MKTKRKEIRFMTWLEESINKQTTNFSEWVQDACIEKLKRIKK